MKQKPFLRTFAVASLATFIIGIQPAPAETISVEPEQRIVLMGGGLGSRMVHFGHFETGMHLRYPQHRLFIRNISNEGNTPAFRPHSGRSNQLGFTGANHHHQMHTGGNTSNGNGFAWTDDEWLEHLKPDTLIAFFGFNESFGGSAGLEPFRAELDAFVEHTLKQNDNGSSPPTLVLVAPTAFQDISHLKDVPNGQVENSNLAAYTSIIEAVANKHEVRFVDAFSASVGWFQAAEEPLTVDGALLNDAGYRLLSKFLIDEIFGATEATAAQHADRVHELVMDKNWLWINDFKIPNGVHVFGRRFKPFGPANYPFEIEKIREMAAIRDQAIWEAAQGKTLDIAALDAQTSELPEVNTNYRNANNIKFLYGEEALATITVPDGYKVEQWATEKEFPNLANPVQMTFDNRGRLWVATMQSYPHWRPGDPRPDDKLLILEDTNGDGKADKETVWADGLHLPMGFAITEQGVFVSQGVNLILLEDTNGDGKADSREVVFSGFDDHDTHHAISAFKSDPSGAILMAEGTFLRTSVETAYGPVRGNDGGFYRFNPQRRHLERHVQVSIPNPWGIAFDEWGQHFYLSTSNPDMRWMLPSTMKPVYGQASHNSPNLINDNRARPTSGLEFISSRHFPDEVQGDIILNNTIGFLGTKQHQIVEDGTGYSVKFRQDLIRSSDSNFRPVDMEFAPDGSLYVVDWHNPLIGHMQHNARDPYRDHDHGRIYRVTYPSRPLVEPPPIAGAPIPQLLENLKLPEFHARERSRRELRGRDADEVMAALGPWVAALDSDDPRHEHHMLEALWLTWGLNRTNPGLLRHMLATEDHRARAAAVRVLRYSTHLIPDHVELLKTAIADNHGRVRMEALVAASWLNTSDGLAVLEAASNYEAEEEPSDGDDADYVKVTKGGSEIEITPPAAAAANVTAVTMTLPGENRTINLAQMEVHAGGNNITADIELSMSSRYRNQYPVSNLVDGDRSSFTHTAFEREPWIRLDFDKPTALERIHLWTRSGFEDRFNNAKIVFWKGDEELAEVSVQFSGGGGGGGPFSDDDWLAPVYNQVLSRLNNQPDTDTEPSVTPPDHITDEEIQRLFVMGAEVYGREGHCATCHQPDGTGLPDSGFPPLDETRWVTGSDDRLIKLTLDGLHGPMTVKGRDYPGLVPMTPFRGLLDDEEIAAVLTYIRNDFGNQAPPILPNQVKALRDATAAQSGSFYSPAELIEQYPLE